MSIIEIDINTVALKTLHALTRDTVVVCTGSCDDAGAPFRVDVRHRS